ncbi:hypothetical protein K501DRAFT_270838 [Backusella circina FSU 941]|nr:hypothetical protein K501DRAFT_270838 [Backusella circina FSU 941]
MNNDEHALLIFFKVVPRISKYVKLYYVWSLFFTYDNNENNFVILVKYYLQWFMFSGIVLVSLFKKVNLNISLFLSNIHARLLLPRHLAPTQKVQAEPIVSTSHGTSQNY